MGNRSEGTTPAFLTDYRARAPFKAAVTRRRFLLGGAAATGVAVASTQLGGIARAATVASATKAGHRTGTIADLKHVVILMQENRSFDHYFGTLRGVRGFADKQVLMGNQDLWNTTALFVTYNEHDGYFDHVLPPTPDASQKNEFIDGLPIGFGSRVPMIIASPWTPTDTTT